MTRLFEIVQMLAAARRPMTGADLAERLEVTPRTVYRDVAALQAMRIPIEGERGYRDETGRTTDRVLRPFALVYFSETANLVAWCELRQAIRHFRPDRVTDARLAGGHFRGDGARLRKLWTEGWTQGPT
ncbi:helix-turn-helix transcriptional regulator [Silicimonas algicola]|nr:HTH domain-containing protein [Silicimonas algicola]